MLPLQNFLRVLAFLLSSGVLVSCSSPFRVTAPQGFVVLKDQALYDYRATSADGVVLAVRSIKHDPKGDIDFWVQAIRNRMRGVSGYALLATKPVSTRGGLKGVSMRFGHDEGRTSYLYDINLFVTEKYLHLIEFGGTKEELVRLDKQVAWVVHTFEGV